MIEIFLARAMERDRVLFVHYVQSQFGAKLNRDEVDDVVQNGFIKAWQRRDQFVGSTYRECVMWLYRIFLRAGLDELRRNKRKGVSLDDVTAVVGDAGPGMDFVDDAYVATAALRSIRRVDRELLLLRAYGFTFDEIAETVGLTAIVVKNRLWRARAKLKASEFAA